MLLSGGTSARSLMDAKVTTPLRRKILPTSSSERITRMPLFFEEPRSWSRSGNGISSIEPLMVRVCAARPALGISGRRSGGAEGSTATTLRMLVPMSTRSPSFREARAIFSPLTKVPLVEPRSSIMIDWSEQAMRAWRRETMSSTRTMSRSLERPTMISGWVPSGYSPPWYLPEMKRSASRRRTAGAWLSIGGRTAMMHGPIVRGQPVRAPDAVSPAKGRGRWPRPVPGS